MIEQLSRPHQASRRTFIGAAAGILTAALSASSAATRASASTFPADTPKRKIPIGVFDPVYDKLSLDQMLDTISALGLEAVEIGTGGYPGSNHCPVDELLADAAKARAWKKKFTDRNIQVLALSCHGNPVHPDPALAERSIKSFRNTVLLAERLEVPVIVGFSGCPAGNPADKTPNWITYGWPPEYSEGRNWGWKEKLIPYWKEAAKFAREHGIRKLALEMHPNFSVYNPRTLLKLREAVGEEIGANCDLSHLFWQGCNPVEVIRMLGKQGAIFHAHMKDTVLFPDNVAKYGVLNFAFETSELPDASATFRAVGYGHSAALWKDVMLAYLEVGYQGFFSIENEDPILPGPVGAERAAFVLKNIRAEILGA
jgi:sugar phosphate isomerase/epimerase